MKNGEWVRAGIIVMAVAFSASIATAQTAPATSGTPAATATPPPTPRRLDVSGLKEKYWEHDNGPDLSVVQNRIYTKTGKFNFELLGGTISHDPFLNTLTYGALVGFSFSEVLGIDAFYWKGVENNSSAYGALVIASGFGANSDPIYSMVGGDLVFSVLYGKLSLLGKAILHFDLYLLGGAGEIGAANGIDFAPWVGVGQQIYLATWLSLRLDYRYFMYTENTVELFRPATKGNILSTNTTFAGALTFGLNILFL